VVLNRELPPPWMLPHVSALPPDLSPSTIRLSLLAFFLTSLDVDSIVLFLEWCGGFFFFFVVFFFLLPHTPSSPHAVPFRWDLPFWAASMAFPLWFFQRVGFLRFLLWGCFSQWSPALRTGFSTPFPMLMSARFFFFMVFPNLIYTFPNIALSLVWPRWIRVFTVVVGFLFMQLFPDFCFFFPLWLTSSFPFLNSFLPLSSLSFFLLFVLVCYSLIQSSTGSFVVPFQHAFFHAAFPPSVSSTVPGAVVHCCDNCPLPCPGDQFFQ